MIDEGSGSIERGAAQIVIAVVLIAVAIAVLSYLKKGLTYHSTGATWVYDDERKRRRRAEEAGLSADELVKKRLREDSRQKWGSEEEIAMTFANAIQRLKQTQYERMREVSELKRKLKMEKHESLLPWKTIDGRAAEATMRAAINVLDESFERLTEATGQYSAGISYFVTKGKEVRKLEQARTEFGERLMSDVIALVCIITETRLHPATAKPWSEAREILDDGDRLDEWARNQVRHILAAEELAAQRAYLAHDLLMDIEMSYSAAEPDSFRRRRMEKELRIIGAHAASSRSSSPQEPPSAQPPLSGSEQQRRRLCRDQIARDSITFWNNDPPSEDSDELFGTGAADNRTDPPSPINPDEDAPEEEGTIEPGGYLASEGPEQERVQAAEPTPEAASGTPIKAELKETPPQEYRRDARRGARGSPPEPPPRSGSKRASVTGNGQQPVKATTTQQPRPVTGASTSQGQPTPAAKDGPQKTAAEPKPAAGRPDKRAAQAGSPNFKDGKRVTSPTVAAKRTEAPMSAQKPGGKGKLNKMALSILTLALLGQVGDGAGLGGIQLGDSDIFKDEQPALNDTTSEPPDKDVEGGVSEAPLESVRTGNLSLGQDSRGGYTNEWFTAYDCRKLSYPERRVIDVTRIGDCPNSEKDFKPAKNVKVAVLQAPVPIRIEAQRCRAWMEKTAHSCGRYHINYGSLTVEPRAIFKITRQHCADLFRTQQWECKANTTGGCFAEHGSGPRFINIGIENVVEWVSWGSHDDGFYCHQATTWIYQNKQYGKETLAYEKTKMHILVEPVHGQLNLEEGTVDFPKIGIFDAPYDTGEKNGDDLGYIYWQPKAHTCGEELTVITNGSIAQLYLPTRPHLSEPYRDAIVLLEEDERVGGFLIKGTKGGCVPGCFKTQVSSILICLDEVHPFSEGLAKIQMGDPNPETRAEMAIVVTYSLFESKLWTQDKFRKITEKLCELSRGTWWSLISSTQQSTREIEYLLRKMDGKNPQSTLNREGDVGYNIVTAAGAVIIEECPVIVVRLTVHPNCTENIPVRIPVDGGPDELAFVDPVTRNIEPYPRVTICNKAYPNHFYINEKWICSTPEYNKCAKTPTKLAPDVSWDEGVTMEDVTSFKPTLYSERTWTEARRYRKAVHAREAIIKELMMERTNRGTAASGSTLGFNMVGISWEKFVKELNDHLWGPSAFIVKCTVYILAGVIVLMMARWLLVTMLQICRYIVKRGPGWWILYALYNSLFVTFSIPQKILKAAHEMTQRDVDHIVPPGEELDEVKIRVMKRRMEEMEVQFADLVSDNRELRRMVARGKGGKTAEEKLSLIHDSVDEGNANLKLGTEFYNRLRMGLPTSPISGASGNIASAASTGSYWKGPDPSASDHGGYPQPARTSSSNVSECDVPEFELKGVSEQAPESHDHDNHGEDSDEPGRNDQEQE